MSGLKNTAKRMFNLGHKGTYATNDEIRQKKKAKVTAGKNKMFGDAQLPDEEEIRRLERRKSAKRRSARASTVLTDRDTLG